MPFYNQRSPLLFLIYVFYMIDTFNSMPFMLADDTILLSICPLGVASSLQPDLGLLGTWCSSSQMIFNFDRCHQVSFSRNMSTASLSILGENISYLYEEKDFGLILPGAFNSAEKGGKISE